MSGLTREQRIAALRTAIAADLEQVRLLRLRIAGIEDRTTARLQAFMDLVASEESR